MSDSHNSKNRQMITGVSVIYYVVTMMLHIFGVLGVSIGLVVDGYTSRSPIILTSFAILAIAGASSMFFLFNNHRAARQASHETAQPSVIRTTQGYVQQRELDQLLSKVDAEWDGTALPARDLSRGAVSSDEEERW